MRRELSRLVSGWRWRDHWLFALLMAGGIVLRTLAVIAYRPALVFYGDSYFYLTNAASLRTASLHPAGYAVLLAALSRFGGSVMAVAIAQHLLGIASGAIVYALLLRHNIRPWLAAIGSAPLLLDGYQIDLEHMVMAETLTTFLLVAAFALLLWRPTPARWQIVGAAACVAWAAVTRSDAIVAIIPAALLLLGRRRSQLVRTGLLAAPFVALLFAYAALHAAYNGNFTIGGNLGTGMLLYGRTATFADCNAIPKSDLSLCDTKRTVDARLRANFYLWSPESPMRKRFGDSPSTYLVPEAPLTTFALDTIRAQPLDYLRVTTLDTAKYFQPLRTTGPQDEPLMDWRFPTAIKWEPNVFVADQGFVKPGEVIPSSVCPVLVTWAADFLNDYQTVGFTPGPVLLLAVVLVIVGVLGRRGSRPAILLTVAGLLILFVSSAVLEFDYRYLLPAQPLIVMGGVLSLRQFRFATRDGGQISRRLGSS